MGDFELLAEADSANLNDICRAGERLLLASYRGVWELTKESGGYRLKRCPEMAAERDMFIYSLFLDQGGRLYLSRNTTDIRIYHFDEPTGMFRPGEIIPGTGLALKFLEVEASRMLWVATSVGLA